MANAGKKVKVHYVGTLNDGSVFDSSRERNEPLEFTCMAGMMIPGFDKAVDDMEVGETRSVTLAPEDAYGAYDEEQILEVPIDRLPGAEELSIGDDIVLSTDRGMPMRCVVKDKGDDTITFDMNHPLAGKELTFEIELLEVE